MAVKTSCVSPVFPVVISRANLLIPSIPTNELVGYPQSSLRDSGAGGDGAGRRKWSPVGTTEASPPFQRWGKRAGGLGQGQKN